MGLLMSCSASGGKMREWWEKERDEGEKEGKRERIFHMHLQRVFEFIWHCQGL